LGLRLRSSTMPGKQKGKKGQKKRIIDPFTKKEWYDLKAPSSFTARQIGKTPVTRSAAGKNAAENLKGRTVWASLGDLKSEGEAFRKFRLRVEYVHGTNCLTQFYGMELSRDKLCSLVKKYQSLIEAFVDVRTSDDYTLRLFCIGFTQKRENQNPFRKTFYAQQSQIRAIRKRMITIIKRETAQSDLKAIVDKLIPETLGKEIEKGCESIYPLKDVYIRKVKTIRSPKLDVSRVLEAHGGAADGASGDVDGAAVERPDDEDMDDLEDDE